MEFEGDRIVFSFVPAQRLFEEQVEQNRAWLESLAARMAGRKMPPSAWSPSRRRPRLAPPASGQPGALPPVRPAGPADALKAAAAADPGMQALLDLFPAEIEDVEDCKALGFRLRAVGLAACGRDDA